ncbi:hypothetical protein [Neisseria sp. 74A18]|uniref:hypothetical protein n=1 Tax=Neisseria sp. 74A18 TaxID=1696094 RepID=UPI0006CAD320|nr:hypothetical protein [Neisseria sp. 74A18]KPN74060.1 hypothetical protein AKG43_04525 [Neisseria sp. 74A18]
MKKLINMLIGVNELVNVCAEKFVSFLEEKMLHANNKKQQENIYFAKYPRTFLVAISLSFIFLIFLFLDFWTGNIDKSRLDTFIVVASLISLIINNISKLYKTEFFDDYIAHLLKYIAGSVLVWFSIGIILFLFSIIILAIIQPSYLPQFNTAFFLSIIITVVIVFLIAFTFLVLSKILLNKKNLFYAIWWMLILVLYVIKIYT